MHSVHKFGSLNKVVTSGDLKVGVFLGDCSNIFNGITYGIDVARYLELSSLRIEIKKYSIELIFVVHFVY